jgi:phage N-6-adenine-methyltransferase
MNTEVMFSSKSDEWETPQWLFDELNKEFNFQLDVCADRYNAKCNHYIGYTYDANVFDDDFVNGLNVPWAKRNWMNPPYGREIGEWIKKAYESSRGGCCGGLFTSCKN